MPGEPIELEGDIGALAAALAVLSDADLDFVIVGGLAVMLRLTEQHRVTADLDSVFDNDTEIPTTETLIARGIADPAGPIQRVNVAGASVDVIDTFALPAATDELPDEPKDRLFVCAHRYAFEASTPMAMRGSERILVVPVAPVGALVAMKAHALRHATRARRAAKRSSDLHDLYRLAAGHLDEIDDALAAAPWDLRGQVSVALDEDVLAVEQDLAELRRARGGPHIDPDDYSDVIVELTARLRR